MVPALGSKPHSNSISGKLPQNFFTQDEQGVVSISHNAQLLAGDSVSPLSNFPAASAQKAKSRGRRPSQLPTVKEAETPAYPE